MHGERLLWGEATWSGQRELAVRSVKEQEGARGQGTGTAQAGDRDKPGNEVCLREQKSSDCS